MTLAVSHLVKEGVIAVTRTRGAGVGTVNDIEDWIRAHGDRLEDIARDTDLSPYLVHLAAVLILEGLADDEIYGMLGEHVISMDGQHNPLTGAPEAIEEIRLLALSS